MSTNDLLARHGPALRTGGESLRRWVRENERRAVAAGAYLTAVLVMLLVVVMPVADGEERAGSASEAAAVEVPNHYTVKKDDTLAGIAARFGLTVDEVRTLNPGVDPMALEPGSTLRLRENAPPVRKETRDAAPKAPKADKKPARSAAPPKAAAPAPPPPPPPPPPPAQQARTTHTVAPGETLTSIAARYGTTVDQLLALNPGIDPYSMVAGQEVAVP